jgi:hypothetical protein
VSESPAGSRCDACGAVRGATAFVFQTRDGALVKCRRCALRHRPMLERSLAVAAVVGTLLLIINQGDVLLSASRLAVEDSPHLPGAVPGRHVGCAREQPRAESMSRAA